MKNRSVKGLLAIPLLLAGCTAVSHQLRHLTGDAQSRLADDVVIERDEWGVPHVQGETDAATAFGVAWAMAEDNFRQVEESYIEALGLSAFYYGERYLADDLVRVAFRAEAGARAEYERATASERALLNGFAEGLNYWLRKHPEVQARAITRYEGWMPLALARRAMAGQSVGGLRLGEVAALAGAPLAGARPFTAPGAGAAWAIAPAHSASGRALLLASLDRPFFGSEQPYELEVRSRTGWHVYGLARLGQPVPHTGRNERLAWAHAGTGDSAVLQVVVFGSGSDSLLYRVGERWEQAESWADTVQVNTDTGVQARVYRFLRTVHGPVIARRGDTAFVARLLGFDEGGSLQWWNALGRARSLPEFAAVLARGPLPLATACADVDGNIMAARAPGDSQLVNPAEGEIRLGGSISWQHEAARPGSGWTAAGLAGVVFGALPGRGAEEIALLVHEWEQVGGRDSRRAFAMDTAVELLRRWRGAAAKEAESVAAAVSPVGPADATADSVASAAAALYYVWQETYRSPALAGGVADAGDVEFPRFHALEQAVARLQREWRTARVPWSELVRLQRRHPSGDESFRDSLPSIPVAGAPDGALFVLRTAPGDGSRRYGTSGTSAVMVTEFASPPVTGTVMVFGQSADPASPHFFDQASRYAAGALKEGRFGRGGGRTRYHPGQRARVLQPETAEH